MTQCPSTYTKHTCTHTNTQTLTNQPRGACKTRQIYPLSSPHYLVVFMCEYTNLEHGGMWGNTRIRFTLGCVCCFDYLMLHNLLWGWIEYFVKDRWKCSSNHSRDRFFKNQVEQAVKDWVAKVSNHGNYFCRYVQRSSRGWLAYKCVYFCYILIFFTYGRISLIVDDDRLTL